MPPPNDFSSPSLWERIQAAAQHLGFAGIGVAAIGDMQEAITKVQQWCAEGMHGEMEYLVQHIPFKQDPRTLVDNVQTVLMVRLDYLPHRTWGRDYQQALEHPEQGRALISAYALGRDYHKVLRKKLHRLAEAIQELVEPFDYRAFVDSGPVLEVEYAQKSGLGWRGKHTLLLGRTGSWFFLGSLLTTIPWATFQVPAASIASHCGSCQRCLEVCPTQAIIAPYRLDARRCISYLTIEYSGSIPLELRRAIGTRIYGCDDCQIICPWNKFAQVRSEGDFAVRHHLDALTLLEVWEWTEEQFLHRTEGSAIRRIGYERWLRNIAVAMGNVPDDARIVKALEMRLAGAVSPLVQEHIEWALTQHQEHGKTRGKNSSIAQSSQ